MTHAEIEQQDVVDRYLRRELTEPEAEAFEEHFFGCDECFARVQATERLSAAVRKSAQEDWFAAGAAAAPSRPGLLSWLPIGVAAALAVTVGWLALVRMPELRSKLADSENERRALAQRGPVTAPIDPAANVPVAMLTSTRAEAVPELAVPRGAPSVMLWLDPGPAPGDLDLHLAPETGASLHVIAGLKRNEHGAYAVSVPSAWLAPGLHTIKLMSRVDGRDVLRAEYRLRTKLAN